MYIYNDYRYPDSTYVIIFIMYTYIYSITYYSLLLLFYYDIVI